MAAAFTHRNAFEVMVKRYIMVRYYKGPEASCEHLVDAGFDPSLVYLVHKAGELLLRHDPADDE